jgi:hypothetical protein
LCAIFSALSPISIALGSKDRLLAGHSVSAQHHAALWSLIDSAEPNGLDPQRYLTSVFAKLPVNPADELEQFLPDVWKRDDAEEPVQN